MILNIIKITTLFIIIEQMISNDIPGGEKDVLKELKRQIMANPNFTEAENLARKQYHSSYGKWPGKMLEFSQQIVSGTIFKITFETTHQSSQGKVDISVFCQPWTDTLTVTDIVLIY